MTFIEELRWRGMIQDIMPGTEEQLAKEMTTAYVGIDPTADSLHIGHLVSIMMLKHLQLAGHKPIALVGGATAMIGDPSGKSKERKLLTEEEISKNEIGIKKQLEKFLNFECGKKSAEIVNNNDWFQNISTIHFLRDVGKFLTINYLLNKGFVKERIKKDDLSFTEFNYILMQAYDFLWLLENKNCKLQMGGSDQWGNITTGTELIRRKLGGKAFALTCPLITKADGTKFGKTEGGNVWLDPKRTSPYKFYQYWLNASDADAENYIKIFTFLNKETIDNLTLAHRAEPHLRLLQKRIAQEVTTLVHNEADYQNAVKASLILFGNSTSADLKTLDEQTFLDVFEGVPQAEIDQSQITQGFDVISAFTTNGFLASNSEVRRALKENSLSVNKEKITEDFKIDKNQLINNKFVLLQRGKKNYFVLRVV